MLKPTVNQRYIKKSLLFIFILGILLCSGTKSASAITMSPVKAELAANPGQQISSSFTITNEERDTKTLYILAQNFDAKDETGNPTFNPKKENLASWLELPESVTLGPGEQREIQFTITIPLGTEPGGYFSGIFASNLPPQEKDDGDIALGSQVGTLLLLRVNGSVTEDTDILEFKTKNNKTFFSSLPIDFYFRFQNSGQSWVKPIGDVTIENTIGQTTQSISANPTGSNVLPKSIRRFEVSWLSKDKDKTQDKEAERPPEQPAGYWNKVKHQWKYFALGRYTANLTLTYNNDTSTQTSATIAFWVIPWHFLSVAIPSGIMALILLWFSIKHYNRYIVRKSQRTVKKK